MRAEEIEEFKPFQTLLDILGSFQEEKQKEKAMKENDSGHQDSVRTRVRVRVEE